jgi:CheY-like chemotaxis protein
MKTILLIDNHDHTLDVVSYKLVGLGYKVLIAQKINEAIEYLNKLKSIDLFWMDHAVDHERLGLEFLSEIRNHETHRNASIFIVSHNIHPPHRKIFRDLNINNHYCKLNSSMSQILLDLESHLG